MLLQITEPGDALTPEPGRFYPAIGIDLGTTNSLVAHAFNRQATILTGENGESLLPSVVAYCEGKLPRIGKEAFELIDTIPDQIVTSSKRFMGRSWKEAEEIAKTFALNLETASSSRSFIQLKIGSIVKTPVEISADILRALKERAEKALNQPVEKAVITVPAYFDDAARQATKDAAALAGLSVMRLINEPTAAAYAYGLDQGIEGIYAVYDFGGGTFDFSLLRLTGGVFQVLGTGGDTLLGGDDIDRLVADYFQNLSPGNSPVNSSGNLPFSKSYRQDLKVARYAKEYLSSHEEGTFEWLPNKEYSLGRSTLEPLIAPLIKRTIDICTQVLTEADLTPDEIDGVVMVGGATRIPFIQKQVAEFFGKTPLTNLNPDEVVALGAALQAEALTGTFNTLLLDVTPLSLGLETMGGLVEKIIPRNTPIPARVTQEFTTHQTGQTHMKVHVLQGERELVNDCRSLAEFTLAGIPPLSAGTARIAITFEIDADGLLTVNAVEKTTGIHQEIVVKPSYGMTEEDYRKILL